jgi:hypothetical protein
MSGLPPVVAVPPPVTCQIACIAVSDVTSLTTSSQGGSLLRWDTVRKVKSQYCGSGSACFLASRIRIH